MSIPRSLLTTGLLVVGLATSSCVSVPAAPTGAVTNPPATMPIACTEHGPLVVAVSGRADVPAPDVPAVLAAALARAADEGAPVGIVSVDGDPALTLATSFVSDAGNENARTDDREQFVAGVAAAVREVRADTPHADVLQALRVAADAARAGCPSRPGTILLQDSGLQDVGALDLSRPGQLAAAPGDVAAWLRDQRELPDLQGITVVLVGLGYTAPPQEPLGARQADVLALWTAVIAAAGGDAQVDPSPRSGPAPEGVPDVSEVPVPAPPVMPVDCGDTVVLPDDGPLAFQPDLALFRDPAAAAGMLGRLAGVLAACPAEHIVLTGTTSSAGPQTAAGNAGRRALGLARAEAVAQVLVEMGVDRSRVTAVGAGTSSPWFVPDRDELGRLLPVPAAQNRAVVVTIGAPRGR